jgi:phosphatidate cytidylyltransferase
MLRTRVIVVVILLPIGLAIIYLGGWPFTAFVALILGLAAWEYSQIFRGSKLEPANVIAIIGAASLALGRGWNEFESAPWIISLIFWWLLLVLPCVWLADSGAYFIGRSFGRHKLSPRLSPKKTWEGYIGGIFVGTLGAVGLVYLWNIWAGPGFSITPLQGALLGFLLSAITTLGDLGESMIKRQSAVKDSSNLLPGHGGVFDRIDSWLWAAPIGYYFIIWIVG